jgi:putative membrane protein
MKKLFLFKPLFIICAIAIFVSCNNPDSTEKKDSKETAEDRNDEKFNKPGEKDAQALVDAYSGSLFEMQLSDSVKTWAADDDVKTLASAMSVAHSSINSEIKQLASKKAISLPVSITTGETEKISNYKDKKANNLNKDYVDALIDDHKKTITLFEKCAADCNDNDIKTWFGAALPELRKHLDMAMTVQEKLKTKK